MRLFAIGLALTTLSAAAPAATTLREVQTRAVAPAAPLPSDVTSPEGTTRWHLDALPLGAAAIQTIVKREDGLARETRAAGAATASRVLVQGEDAERWLLPDHDRAQMKMGAHVVLRFDESKDGLIDHLQADVTTVGIGWLHLPGDPQEIVLQRVVLFRQRAGERAMRAESLAHRWVSPREGVIAEVEGPPATDLRSRASIASITLVDRVIYGAATMTIYADQIYRGDYVDLKYGWDKGTGTPVSSMVPDPGINNICDLVNLNTWNFSSTTSGNQTATTEVPSVAAESCNTGNCGYQGYPVSGGLQPPILERFDRNLTGTLRKDNEVIQRENRATDVTFWLRAGAQNEGVSGGFGSGETRFCFTDETGKPRNEVPVWQMTHNDAGGWYLQAGDTWTSDPVVSPACEQSFYNCVCGSCGGLFQTLYARGCSNGGQTYQGAQFGKVVKGGVVILPSGHTFNALVERNTTEFCTYSSSACSLLLSTVRTIVYIWEAPYIGAIALLRGPQAVSYASGETGETPCTNFTTLDYTDIGYGLYPPVSITAGAVTDTTASISWNPGNDTHRISGYKIYWDTDSGSSTPYAFNSVTNAGQVVFNGTSATISGLAAGTTYYFTVTSLSNFTDPSSGVVTAYESLKYPTTVSGDPSFSYPVEVTATTTGGGCTPTQAITGVTVDKALPNIHVCWTATADACAVGYDILTADALPPSYTLAGQVGATSCWDGNPTSSTSISYIQVRARGITGEGP
jgi:hypothetical protein